MRIRTLASLGLMAVGVGAVVFVTIGPGLGTTGSTARYITSEASVTDVIDEVSATGTLAAATTWALSFGTAPTISDTAAAGAAASGSGSATGASSWTVREIKVGVGATVKTGDVLASADPTDAEVDVKVATANLAAAKARLKSDKTPLTGTDKKAARLQVTQAKKALANAQTSYNQTVAQNNLKLKQAKASLSRAYQQLADDKEADQPDNVLAQDQNAITQASENLASVKLQIAQSKAQASQQVSSAKLAVTSAEYAYSQKSQSADAATIKSDEAAVAQAEQALATAKTTLAHATLVAPADGIVTSIDIRVGAAASGTAITMRSAALQVTGSVAEADLPSLKVGQDVTVTLTALDADVAGRVEQIDQEGAAAASGGVVSYGITVALDEPPAGAAPGMSATVSVTTRAARSVLAVPAIALQVTGGQYAVRVLDVTGQPQSIPVEVGLVTSSLAEITGGISAGTPVVVGTSSTRQGSTTTTTTGIPGLGGGGGAFPGGRDLRP